MKSSFTIITPGRRATHMPTGGRPHARVSCLKLCAGLPDFRPVGRSRVSSDESDGAGAVLAKSVGAVPASHSANARATLPALFAKRPRARPLCPRPLRGVDEKGRGRRGKGRATCVCLIASVMMNPRNLPAKTSRRRGRPAGDVKVLLRRSHDGRVSPFSHHERKVVAFDLLLARVSPVGRR